MSKKDYRVCNWAQYNQALVNRGSITFWFCEESIKGWHVEAKSGKRGRPMKYSDTAIICALSLKAIYKLTYRSTQGFISSLVSMLRLSLGVPNYTLLCKRQNELDINLVTKNVKPGKGINIVVDSTGLKVFGEGEWKVRQHGYIKKRLWRKLHLAVNIDTQEIESFELTDLGTQDCQGFSKVIKKINKAIDTSIGDGAYDRFSCYELGAQNNFTIIAPPQHNAKSSKERWDHKKKASPQAIMNRDETVLKVREMGYSEWKKTVGYHKRSLAETAIFRIKRLIGSRFTSKLMANQKIEIAIWCQAINKMTRLGMPNSRINF